ncbi:hypothetical protein Tco_0303680 [Tanacetum coccineum]
MKKKIGNGNATRFWTDVWVGTRSLKERFPRVYAMEGNKQCMVSDRWVDDQWHWNWHRNMSERGRTGEQYIDMQQELHHLELSDREDTWKCSMKHDGSFTVACIRRHIDEKILHSGDSETRWNNIVPIKIWKRIFRWIDMDQPTFEVIADVFNWIDVVNVRQKARGVLEAIFISAMWVMWQYRNNVIFGGVKMKKNVMFDCIVSHSFEWCSSRGKMSLLIGRCGYKAQ